MNAIQSRVDHTPRTPRGDSAYPPELIANIIGLHGSPGWHAAVTIDRLLNLEKGTAMRVLNRARSDIDVLRAEPRKPDLKIVQEEPKSDDPVAKFLRTLTDHLSPK